MSEAPDDAPEPTAHHELGPRPEPPPEPTWLRQRLSHAQATALFLIVVLVGLGVGGLFVISDDEPASIPKAELGRQPRLIAPRAHRSRMRYVQDEPEPHDPLQDRLEALEKKVAKLEKTLEAKDAEHDQALASAALLVTALEAAQRHHALHGGVYGGHYRISVLLGFAATRPFVRVVWLPLEDGYAAEARAVADRIAGYVRAYTTQVETVVERDRR